MQAIIDHRNTSDHRNTVIATNQSKKPARKTMGVGLAVAAGLLLSGCSGPVVGALSIGEIASIANLVSTFMSGRDLSENALAAANDENCQALEGVLRPERGFCENESAKAGEFRGIFALLDGQSNIAMAQADIEVRRVTDPVALGFAPIDRRVAVDAFSLDIVHEQTSSRQGRRIAFGMLQASYGQSWSYELTTRRSAEQVASAGPVALPATRTDGAIISPVPVVN
ncbi:MAG: hypothetical protein RLN89_13745 [Parvibaculum sp.]